MSELPPDLRKHCRHTPGLQYKSVSLVCALKEHAPEFPHFCFVPSEGTPGEGIRWTSAGRLFAPTKYGKKRPGSIAARDGGYTGDLCDSCSGTHMVRNGSCLLCTDCGSTTGCS